MVTGPTCNQLLLNIVVQQSHLACFSYVTGRCQAENAHCWLVWPESSGNFNPINFDLLMALSLPLLLLLMVLQEEGGPKGA
jgi:hypothetical protein